MARDLMFQQEIKQAVRQAYAAISTGGGEVVARRLYADQEFSEIPAGAVEWALGVGDPVRYAFLQPGEAALDVGSGGGIDTILAARRVGPEGMPLGWMCWRRCASAAGDTPPRPGWTAGPSSCGARWRISRCPTSRWMWCSPTGVLNLSARKSRALAEIFRVLGPGGRICIDLTVEGELPPEVANDQSAWAG